MVPNSQDWKEESETIEEESETEVQDKESAEEREGKLGKDHREDKLMHTVLNVDKDKLDNAKVLNDAVNNNVTSFTPDFSFEQMVKDYKTAEKIYGETMIRELTGYDPGYVSKNLQIPEFKRELKQRIEQNVERMKNKGLLDKQGFITDEGYELSTLSLLLDLDDLKSKGLQGEKENKKRDIYGERKDYRSYRKGDRYKDISMKKTINKAIRRGRTELSKEDFTSATRQAKGKINVIYGVDISGSMKGDKIKAAKRAGVALANRAILNKDKAGLILFNSKIEKTLAPTNEFQTILKEISHIKTSGETDISLCIEKAIELFPEKDNNHLVLITDAVQTLGKNPKADVLEKVSIATDTNITITIIGINLSKEGEELARKIIDISNGKLYGVRSLEEIDKIVLEDYNERRHI